MQKKYWWLTGGFVAGTFLGGMVFGAIKGILGKV
jgi:hypothetical protein